MDLLTVQQKEYRASVSGEKLYFVKQFLGRSLLITFEDDGQRRFKQRVTLMSCEQRWSITRGQLDSGADVSGSMVSGRFSGCVFSGNWWIRAMPMFGAEQSPRAFDGYVKNDGSFQVTASLAGQRYIFVVGKDKQPIKAIAVDVVVGGKNETGIVDLTGLCPK